jgi:hypothetical protein
LIGSEKRDEITQQKNQKKPTTKKHALPIHFAMVANMLLELNQRQCLYRTHRTHARSELLGMSGNFIVFKVNFGFLVIFTIGETNGLGRMERIFGAQNLGTILLQHGLAFDLFFSSQKKRKKRKEIVTSLRVGFIQTKLRIGKTNFLVFFVEFFSHIFILVFFDQTHLAENAFVILGIFTQADGALHTTCMATVVDGAKNNVISAYHA